MATESPLFQSSMELLGHSISHFNSGAELDRKLVILHLANSVELLLKDLVLDTGESIYKNPKETITVYACLEVLNKQGIELTFLNKIELLIDERNALQHRFGSPNELTSIFYMNIAVSFFRDVLKVHYNLDFDETMEQFADNRELHTFRMREPSDDKELENLRKLASVHPLGALLSAMAYLERIIAEFATDIGVHRSVLLRPLGMTSARFMERFGLVIPEGLQLKLDELRRLRNMAAHGRSEPTKADVVGGIETIEEFESFLATVDRGPLRLAAEHEARRREMVFERSRSEATILGEVGEAGSAAGDQE